MKICVYLAKALKI